MSRARVVALVVAMRLGEARRPACRREAMGTVSSGTPGVARVPVLRGMAVGWGPCDIAVACAPQNLREEGDTPVKNTVRNHPASARGRDPARVVLPVPDLTPSGVVNKKVRAFGRLVERVLCFGYTRIRRPKN